MSHQSSQKGFRFREGNYALIETQLKEAGYYAESFCVTWYGREDGHVIGWTSRGEYPYGSEVIVVSEEGILANHATEINGGVMPPMQEAINAYFDQFEDAPIEEPSPLWVTDPEDYTECPV